MSEEKKVGLTAGDLRDIFKTVIEEARKPVVTEQQERQLKQQQEDRAASVAQIEEMRRNEEWQQTVCTHRHSMKNGGAPRVVQVNSDARSGGVFMVCLRCQKVIRPETDPVLYNPLFEENSVVNY
jgi:RNase P subunit RPR2